MPDIIGTMYKETGVMLTDSEGMEYPEKVDVSGYHINLLPAEMLPELQPFVVEPSRLRRKYAGRDDTVCLRFESQAQYESHFPPNDAEIP